MLLSRVLLVGMALAGVAWGQKSPAAAPAPTGTVTGHVTFAETRQPARFAEVDLVRKPDAAAIAADKASARYERAVSGEEDKTPLSLVAISGRTALDGAFTIRDVPLGDYYVLPKMAGYAIPIGRISNEKQGSDLDTLMRAIADVHVTANHSSDIDLVLHRGGAIAGRLHFEDGSPVVEMDVKVEPVEGIDDLVYLRPDYLREAIDSGYPGRNSAATDDQGRFRIAGLLPGKYVVKTDLLTAGGDRLTSDGAVADTHEVMSMFAPSAFHKTEARAFEIKAAEEIVDADIEVDLSGLHVVKGLVLVKEDRHAPNRGFVRLTSPDDKEFGRSAALRPDGTYHFGFVPPGTYTLTVVAAEDVSNPDELDLNVIPQVLRRFAQAKVDVIVGEHDVQVEDLLLVESKPGQPKPQTQ
jgi:hypothetical protein